MDRRRFLALALGGLASPLTAEAQQAGKVWRIAVLHGAPSAIHREAAQIFRRSLRDLGYTEGQNILISEDAGETAAQLLEAANRLLRSRPDVLVAFTTQPAVAAKTATRTIPIVFAVVSDPVASGLVETLARPGGNATGATNVQPDVSAKHVQLLKELMPGLSRVAVLWNANHQGKAIEFRETERAARDMGVSVHSAEVRGIDDFEPALKSIVREKAEAMIVLGEPLVIGRISTVREFVLLHQLPATWQSATTLTAGGGLLSYGVYGREQYLLAATYVDKILKGAKPADLPVEQPTKFELVINLKTARALGLTITPPLLLRADQVIE